MRWRFSLRSLFIGVFAFAICMAMTVRIMNLRTTVDLIESRGGVIQYASDVQRDGLFRFDFRSSHSFVALATGCEKIAAVSFGEKYLENDFSMYREDELWDALASLQDLRHLKIASRSLTRFEQLQRLNLETLHFEPDGIVDGCDAIAKCSSLREFKIERLASDSVALRMDLSFLQEMSFLHSFEMNYCTDEELKSIATFQNLESLRLEFFDIASHSSAPDPTPLRQLTNLKSLHLEGRHNQEVDFLENLKQLQHLELLGMSVANTSSLTELTNLENLIAPEMDLQDCNPLRKLQRLQTLTFASLVGDGNVIRDLPALQKLTITKCDNRMIDFLPISLVELCLNGEEVVDIVIHDNPHLSLLSSGIPLKRVGFLSSLPGLTELKLRGTRTPIDMEILEGLTKLTHLAIWECDCENVMSLAQHASLVGVILPDDTPAETISQLTVANPRCSFR